MQERLPGGHVAMAVLLLVACHSSDKSIPQEPDKGSAPPSVHIPAEKVEVGFAEGSLRRAVSTASFRISKHPITAEQYAACVDAKRCPTLDPESECSQVPKESEKAAPEGRAVVCPGLNAAREFCGWVSGRLPTLAEWLLAARGPQVQRYPWGAEPPTCAQHPLAPELAPQPDQLPDMPDPATREGCETGTRTGAHSDGASPYGVEDILLTRGELLAQEEDPLLPACGVPFKACVVHGIVPGAIDSVEPIHKFRKEGTAKILSSVTHPYGFRCVWDAKE